MLSSWSSRATIYGTSALAAGYILGGVIAIRFPLVPLIFSSLLRVLSLAISGMAVLKCQDWDVISEIIYIMTFSVMGIAEVLCYVTANDVCLSKFPRRPGLFGGLYGVSLGVGTVAVIQIIVALRVVFYNDHVSAATIFFVLGIFTIVTSQPLLLWQLLSSCTSNKHIREKSLPDETDRDLKSMRSNSTSDQVIKISVHDVLRLLKNWQVMKFLIAVWLVFIPIEGILAVLEPIEFSLWNEKVAPAATLSAVSFGMVVVGRLIWCLVADCVGLSRLLCFVILMQGCSLLTIGLLTTGLLTPLTQTWVKYVTITLFNFYLFMFPAVKVLSPGLSYQILEYADGVVILSMVNIVVGVSGIVGPLIIQTMYDIHDRYDIAFCCCGGLILVTLVLLTFCGKFTTSVDRLCCCKQEKGNAVVVEN